MTIVVTSQHQPSGFRLRVFLWVFTLFYLRTIVCAVVVLGVCCLNFTRRILQWPFRRRAWWRRRACCSRCWRLRSSTRCLDLLLLGSWCRDCSPGDADGMALIDLPFALSKCGHRALHNLTVPLDRQPTCAVGHPRWLICLGRAGGDGLYRSAFVAVRTVQPVLQDMELSEELLRLWGPTRGRGDCVCGAADAPALLMGAALAFARGVCNMARFIDRRQPTKSEIAPPARSLT